jgi:hypothetical protein
MLINETVVPKNSPFQLSHCVAISGDLRGGEGQEGNISEASEACSLYSKGNDNSVTGQT